jgi:hypothetical protein
MYREAVARSSRFFDERAKGGGRGDSCLYYPTMSEQWNMLYLYVMRG